MPFLAKLFGWLSGFIPFIVQKVLAMLGVGVVSYVGMQQHLQMLTSAVLNQAGGVPSDVAAYLALAGVDVCISMMLSALSMRVTLISVNGAVNRMTFTNKNVTAT